MSATEIRCTDWPAPLPDWIKVGRTEPHRLVNLTQLAAAEKQRLWREIRTQRPALAALLQEPNLQALRQAFEADLCIDMPTDLEDSA